MYVECTCLADVVICARRCSSRDLPRAATHRFHIPPLHLLQPSRLRRVSGKRSQSFLMFQPAYAVREGKTSPSSGSG
jgi:hypothetical protein